jgi:hypothetical protein
MYVAIYPAERLLPGDSVEHASKRYRPEDLYPSFNVWLWIVDVMALDTWYSTTFISVQTRPEPEKLRA